MGKVSIENVMSETTMRAKTTASNQRPALVSDCSTMRLRCIAASYTCRWRISAFENPPSHAGRQRHLERAAWTDLPRPDRRLVMGRAGHRDHASWRERVRLRARPSSLDDRVVLKAALRERQRLAAAGAVK